MRADDCPRKKSVVTRGEARGLLLDAAERLIATHGVDGISLRGITAAAGVGPSILHYHFGNLDTLVEALVMRHMEGLMTQRREYLRALAQQPVPSARGLVEALVLPPAQLAIDAGEAGMRYVRLIARLYSDRNPIIDTVSVRYLGDSQTLIPKLLRRAVPGVPMSVLSQRLVAVGHTLLQVLAEFDAPPRPWQQGARVPSRDGLWQRVEVLIEFLSAGLAAPHNAKARGGKKRAAPKK
jgi:AcrR family transcriptional regulator